MLDRLSGREVSQVRGWPMPSFGKYGYIMPWVCPALQTIVVQLTTSP